MSIKLYSAEWCPSCVPIKEFVEENNLEVEVLDVDDQDNMNLFRKTGYRHIPLLQLGEETFVANETVILSKLRGMLNGSN